MTNNYINDSVETKIQCVQQERYENRTLFNENRINQQTFENTDTALVRELEKLFLQQNLSKILF